tara:strand:- start:9565 stop:10686 length:1122 start_codon:yes stop_codon:yes gene_type:complete
MTEIGIAIIGCGRIGRIRGKIARDFPGISWIGLCDINEELGLQLKDDIQADYFSTNYSELINCPEVDAVIVATSTWSHFEPTLIAIEGNKKLFIEKPLTLDAKQSQYLVTKIKENNIDACVGYTQRFRRKFISVKEKVSSGQIGDITCAVTRTFMNRMGPQNELRLTQDRNFLTPMVVSGTHSLDMSLWLINDYPKSVYAKSSEKILGELGTKDATFGIFSFDDKIWSMNICWALPKKWPGASYGLQMGFVGTRGAIDIEDTHRDVILASEYDQGKIYRPKGREDEVERNVDFLTSYPPGDIYNNELWGPMKDETFSWLQRVCLGKATPHTTAAEAHKNLMLTLSMDLSAKINKEIELSIDEEELMSRLNKEG